MLPDLHALLAKAQRLLPHDPNGAEACLDAALWILPLGGPFPAHASTTRARLQNVILFIDDHIAEPLSRERLAALADVSPSQLTRIFKARFGIGPCAYVRDRRIVLAQAGLRRSHQPLAELALDCGFNDQSHLCRAFRHALGSTPARWRRDQGPSADEAR
jgi:AraC family transcriptional regulator